MPKKTAKKSSLKKKAAANPNPKLKADTRVPVVVGIGSFLKGIELHAGTLAKQLEAEGSPRVENARSIADWLTEAIGQTRNLALGLHLLGEPADLHPALERLAKFARESGRAAIQLDHAAGGAYPERS